jgi:hypothetical protein
MAAMRLPGILASLAFIASVSLPQLALAAHTFYGEVVHVSVANIKVYDPRTKTTLSFVLTPKFDQVFSADGKTTYQMKNLKKGQYVGVIYDQKALGMRHADRIYILTNRNQRIGTQ